MPETLSNSASSREQARISRFGIVHYSAAASIAGLLIGFALLATFGFSGTAGKPTTAVAALTTTVDIASERLISEDKRFAADLQRQVAEGETVEISTKAVSVNRNTTVKENVTTIKSRSEQPVSSESAAIDISDEDCRKLIVGDWTQQYYGKRSLTVRDNGTATLVVLPNKVSAFLFGPRLQFDIEWQVQDGKALFRTTGGSPNAKIKLANKMWGDHWNQTILDLTQDRLFLLGEDGETKYDWKRPATASE